jgi:fructoselysine and glucoselysine-specific PTS system IIB component
MIKLTRIDDRLLHGQVAFTWVPSLSADCLIVANDKVAKDEFQKMKLTLAKPPSAKLLIKSIADTVLFLNDPRSANLKILILINSVQDALMLAEQVAEVRSINFGGIRTKEGAKSISKAIAVTEEDVAVIKKLLDKDIELEVRQVPSDSKQLLQTLV